MSSARRRLMASALTVTAILALGACGSVRGFNAQTNQQYQAAVGANHRGEIDVLNTLLVENADGSATLSAGVVNKTGSQQQLTSVEVATLDGDALTVRSTKTVLPLPEGKLTNIGSDGDAGGHRIVSGAKAGFYVTVTLSFSDSASVAIEAPVVTRTEAYESVSG